MKYATILCALALVLAACGNESESANTRFVDQKTFDTPIPALRAPDQAVQTEAMGHMNTIYRQVAAKAIAAPDKQAFYQSLNGTLDAGKLAKLGLTEASLTGSYYRPSDYTLSISGNTLTISAAQTGTRGRVDPQTFQLR